MRQIRFRLPWFLWIGVACVAVAAAGPRPVAATLTAQAGAANGGPAIIVTGTGFGTNEAIKLVGFTGDGRQALYPDARSDNNGAFSASLSFEAAINRIQATGDRSRTQAATNIAAPSVAPVFPDYGQFPGQQFPGGVFPGQPFPNGQFPGGQFAPVQPFPGGQFPGNPYPGFFPGQPLPGGQFPGGQFAPVQPVGPGGTVVIGVGQGVNTVASGFAANERISVWITAPDGSVVAQPGAQANAGGTVETTVSFPVPGTWQVTLHGLSTAAQVINRYEVGGAVTNVPGGVFPGQPFPGGQFVPGQPFPGQPFPGQPFPGGQFPTGPTPAPQYI